MTLFWIGTCCLVSGLAILVEHYLPWVKILGKDLPYLGAYILGMLAIIIPLTTLFALTPIIGWMSILALWSVTMIAGLATLGAHALDDWLIKRIQVRETMEREEKLLERIG
jgi:hypothetical protein